jgi:hypothetical protein
MLSKLAKPSCLILSLRSSRTKKTVWTNYLTEQGICPNIVSMFLRWTTYNLFRERRSDNKKRKTNLGNDTNKKTKEELYSILPSTILKIALSFRWTLLCLLCFLPMALLCLLCFLPMALLCLLCFLRWRRKVDFLLDCFLLMGLYRPVDGERIFYSLTQRKRFVADRD